MPANSSSIIIYEFHEFASFTPATQRYIKRSLDVGFGKENACEIWSRDAQETKNIIAQYAAYQNLKLLRGNITDSAKSKVQGDFLGRLIEVVAFDLEQSAISEFSQCRFLYERLLGARIRPWMPAAFCAAAALPQIKPDKRRHLLQSISENAATAATWSTQEPVFFPKWVEKESEDVAPARSGKPGGTRSLPPPPSPQ